MTPPGLSIFFPACNDAATIASLVIAAVQTASRLTPDFEVLVINDGSTDDTASMANELARLYPQVRVVHHEHNRGSVRGARREPAGRAERARSPSKRCRRCCRR